MKVLYDVDISGKRVFVRADLDVDLAGLVSGEKHQVRLQNLKPTVDYLLDHGAKQVVIAGHIGRPEGRDESLSTEQLVGPLEKILNRSVAFRPDFAAETPESLAGLSQLLLFENLRFWDGEEKNDVDFAKQFSALVDIYVNDAFGASHREHASIVALPALLPHYAGLNLQKEVETLNRLLKNPERPFVAIVGGSKIETKIPPIEFLTKVADMVLVGGQLPLDIVKEYEVFEEKVLVATLNAGMKDIDDESINKFKEEITRAKTVVWNGPLGLFEEGFIKGSEEIAMAVIDSGAYSVVGGGETCEFLESIKVLDRFSFVSSGGGAMLEFLSGKELPGIKALE